ncbi:hypothetical protein [Lacticaseibacillus jixiensis]|uniref:hypothetical protein n=1 Tax=Lacticaseibacillus jixiensis TaxID=3231926 RepID=UPI0036F40FD4
MGCVDSGFGDRLDPVSAVVSDPSGALSARFMRTAIVIGLYLMHGVKGSIMYIEILIGLAAIYDAILQIKALNQPKK